MAFSVKFNNPILGTQEMESKLAIQSIIKSQTKPGGNSLSTNQSILFNSFCFRALISCQSPKLKGEKVTRIEKELDKSKLRINLVFNYFDAQTNVEAVSLGAGEIEGEDASGRVMGTKSPNKTERMQEGEGPARRPPVTLIKEVGHAFGYR